MPSCSCFHGKMGMGAWSLHVPKQAKPGSFKKSGQLWYECLIAVQVAPLPSSSSFPLWPAGHHLPLLHRANTALTDLPKKPNWKEEAAGGGERERGKKGPVPRQSHQRKMETRRLCNGKGHQQPSMCPLPRPPFLNILTSFICDPEIYPSKSAS